MSSASATSAMSASCARHVERAGFFRRSGGRPGEAPHREWLHFSLAQDDLTLLVNFSVVEDGRPAAQPGHERHRVVVLVRKSGVWEGDAEELPPEQCFVAGGAIYAAMGAHSLDFVEDRFRLHLKLARRPIEVLLELAPVSHPVVVNNVRLEPGSAPIHWLVVPRLRADGWVDIDGSRHEVRGRLAYHDHNWGRFSHSGLSWYWGHAAPMRAVDPFSVVYARLLSRNQGVCYMHSLMLWRNETPWRVYRDTEVRVEPVGRRRATGVVVPRSASLLAAEVGVDLPARLQIEVRRGGDRLEGSFESVDLARIVVPHDEDLGTTVIHEVFGVLRLRGCVAGELIEFAGEAVFEFLGAGR